ncbi:MAG: hypothetical protein BMS9Abin29_1258 [Gemmatimonadota bacterium]|nr:MAG: hypothetical protein BMS9Abin29_1258 [Gemmatimonadota bacterium]
MEVGADSVVLLTKGTNFLHAVGRDREAEIEVRYDLSAGQAFWRGAKKGFIFGAVPGALTGLLLGAVGEALEDESGVESNLLAWAVWAERSWSVCRPGFSLVASGPQEVGTDGLRLDSR